MTRTVCPRCKGTCTIIWRDAAGVRTGFETCARCKGRGYLTPDDAMRGDVEIPADIRLAMQPHRSLLVAAITVLAYAGSAAVAVLLIVVAVRSCRNLAAAKAVAAQPQRGPVITFDQAWEKP